MTWTVQIDPSVIAPDRALLDLNTGPMSVGAIDWGDAAITAYESQEGQYGNTASDFIIPNRTITISMLLGADESGTEETARAQLQQKIALLQREGGQILRQRAGGQRMFADIMTATLTLPDVYGETGGVEPDVKVVLECLPDFYGDEITLDTISCTGHCNSVLKQSGAQAVIEGDYPARCRIIVTDTSGHDQDALLWGLRSRHYDAASTAAVVYQAEALTPLNSASSVVDSSASGGHAIELASSTIAGVWIPMLLTDIAGVGALTHVGTYRVWARAAADGQFRLIWGVSDIANPQTNDPAGSIPQGGYAIVDLGTIRLDPQPVGSPQWRGVIEVLGNASGESAFIDEIYLQPLDEAAGRLSSVSTPSAGVITAAAIAGAGADVSGIGTVAWTNPGHVTAADGVEAVAVLGTSGPISHYLEASSFGFAIPSGATIAGIVATISRAAGRAIAVVDNRVSLVKAGTVQTTNLASVARWPAGGPSGALSPVDYGGSSNLWGTTWTPSDINNSGFGVALSAEWLSGLPVDAYVDYIAVTVYFTLGSGFTAVQDAVVYAAHAAEIRSEGMFRTADGTVYGPISVQIGDLPRLPPSGMENRPVEMFAKPSQGDLTTLDAAIDRFTVQVKYQPCWLSRP